MPCVLLMSGLLEPIELEDNYIDTANLLNNVAAQGKEFVVTRTSGGDNIILKMQNILTITEKEEGWEGVPSAL
jgi:hypothetical protein